MNASTKMVIRDPSKFHLLATDVKRNFILGVTNAVNVMAGLGRKEAIKNIENSFITRNTFTRRQIQYTPMKESKYIKISAIHSTLGATEKAPYMKRQEEGGLHRPAMGQTLAIPTDLARGGSKRHAVVSSMRVGRIKSKRRRVRSPKKGDYSYRFKSKKAIRVARAYMAFKKGLFIPIGDSKGRANLFIVKEFHKNRHNVAFLLKQVYRFDKPETMTNPEPWLLPASEKVGRQAQGIFNAQMKKLGL
jgi:hypothetical protein